MDSLTQLNVSENVARTVPTEEEAAAISMALEMELQDMVHDYESYIITIKRKK